MCRISFSDYKQTKIIIYNLSSTAPPFIAYIGSIATDYSRYGASRYSVIVTFKISRTLTLTYYTHCLDAHYAFQKFCYLKKYFPSLK